PGWAAGNAAAALAATRAANPISAIGGSTTTGRGHSMPPPAGPTARWTLDRTCRASVRAAAGTNGRPARLTIAAAGRAMAARATLRKAMGRAATAPAAAPAMAGAAVSAARPVSGRPAWMQAA